MVWCIGLLASATPAASAAGEREAVDAAASFQRANDQYRAGKFDEAQRGYQSILESGFDSGAVYYNLGNALVKQGRAGAALWAYLNASRLMPRDPDLRANLDYVHSQLPQATAASIHPPRAARWLTLNGSFSTRELAGLAVVMAWVAALGWGLFGWWPRARPALRPLVWLGSVIAALSLSGLAAQTRWVDVRGRAVAIQQARATFSPEPEATLHFTLPEGALVQVIGQQPGWAQIRRGDGRAGWVPLDSIKPL